MYYKSCRELIFIKIQIKRFQICQIPLSNKISDMVICLRLSNLEFKKITFIMKNVMFIYMLFSLGHENINETEKNLYTKQR
jgi:hypothetical protein